MVAFTPLHTFLLCFSYASATPRLGCCRELNFRLLFLAIEKWEAAQRQLPCYTACAVRASVPEGQVLGILPGAASHKIPVYPCARCCMPLQLLRGFLRPSGDLLRDLPCFGKILCCFNCCVIWFKNVFSCPLVIFFFPSFQFVPCTTYKPNQSLINTWEK